MFNKSSYAKGDEWAENAQKRVHISRTYHWGTARHVHGRIHQVASVAATAKPTTGTKCGTEDPPREHQKSQKTSKWRRNGSYQNPRPRHDSSPRNGGRHPHDPQRKRVHVCGNTARNDWMLPRRVRHHKQTRETWISRYRCVKIIDVCATEIECNNGKNIRIQYFLLKIEGWSA